MSLRSLRFGFLLFFALSGTVAANLLLLQSEAVPTAARSIVGDRARGAAIETAALRASSTHNWTTHPTRAASRQPRRPSWRGVQAVNDEATLTPGKIGIRSRFLPVETGNAVELVKALQRELKSKGYDPGAEDGQAGLVTQAAILAYQYDHGLDLTAEPTEALLQAIVLGQPGHKNSRKRPRAAMKGSAQDVVRLTQRGLKQQGFWAGGVNGQYDVRLSRAIQAFETSQQLPATGRVSGRFMARLVRLSGIRQTVSR